jgi:hypothetical protein
VSSELLSNSASQLFIDQTIHGGWAGSLQPADPLAELVRELVQPLGQELVLVLVQTVKQTD